MFLLTAAALPESRFDSCAICKFFAPLIPRQYWRFWAFRGTKCGSEHCPRLEELENPCRVILPVSALYKADFPRDRFIVSADFNRQIFALTRSPFFTPSRVAVNIPAAAPARVFRHDRQNQNSAGNVSGAFRASGVYESSAATIRISSSLPPLSVSFSSSSLSISLTCTSTAE